MNHQYYQNRSGQEKVYLLLESARRARNIFTDPFNAAPKTGSAADLTAPAVFAMFVSAIFLLLLNYLPLFSEPTNAISIHDAFNRTSIYFETHDIYSLTGRYWTTLTILVVGWITIIFIAHYNDQHHQMYMLGVTLLVLSVILIFIMVRFLLGLLLIKLEQRFGIANYFGTHFVFGISLINIICALQLISLILIGARARHEVGMRGVGTIILFCFLLAGCYKIARHYSIPATPLAQKIEKDKTTKQSAPAAGGYNLPADDQKQRVQISAGQGGNIRLLAKYTPKFYVLETQVTVTNNTATPLDLPFHNSLRINLMADSILLRNQEGALSSDFIFRIVKMRRQSGQKLTIAPGTSRSIRLNGKISHITYDYLLRYFRAHESAEFKLKFFLPMDNHHKTVDVVETENWSMRFVNKEIHGSISE